ncbi:MAG: hypothetical protein H6936_14120 [Burkholderiales bacterium]|nr:hypothetical protein [Nitrosomonas sp.]MCP5275953.1 hypothetical protein [Burkholderiales bacterium]
MPILSDFVVIQGDVNRRVGDGAILWEKNFPTGGHNGQYGILMLMIKGLTVAQKDVDVKINNKSVGKIFRYEGANANHWFTQIINIGPNILKNNGTNELQIEAVDYVGGGSDHFDDFYLRDVVCFFSQST